MQKNQTLGLGLGLGYTMDDLSAGAAHDPTPVVGHFSSRPLSDKEFEEKIAKEIFPIGDSSPLIAPADPMRTDKAGTERFFVDTKALDECISQAENLRDMLQNDHMAMKVVGILSYGLRRSGELLADAIYRHKMATVERKRMEAVAALDNFGKYLAGKREKGEDIKVTSDVRGHYIHIDQDVLTACEKEAFCEAVVSQLDTYKIQFTMAMSAVKAMISKGRSDQMISGIAAGEAGDEARL